MANTERLVSILREQGRSVTWLCGRCGFSAQTYYNRINGLRPFTLNDIVAISTALELSDEERNEIFFDELVTK